jgi:predicted Zn-dependent peptidase
VRVEDGIPRLHTSRFDQPSGMKVVIHPDPSCPLVAVSVWYAAGSSDEWPARTGLAHLFEHLFKNSQNVRRHHYEILRQVGAHTANASTGTDRTAYFEVVPGAALDLALWLESDRMGYFLPGLDGQRLAAQKAVVRSERRQRYENVPHGDEQFAIAAALYPEGHPLRHLTIGLHQHIEAASLDDVAAWYRTWYVPANAVVVVAGGIERIAAEDAVARWFGRFPPSLTPPRATPLAPSPSTRTLQVEDRFATLRRLRWVWPGPGEADTDDLALDVLATSLCAAGIGSLWKSLVYEQPLAQRVSAWSGSHRLGGEWHLVVDLRPDADEARVRGEVDGALRRACELPLDEAFLARIVGRREASVTWQLQSVESRASLIQRGMLHRCDPNGFAEELLQYRRLSGEGVRQAAARWLGPDRAVQVEVVPSPPSRR